MQNISITKVIPLLIVFLFLFAGCKKEAAKQTQMPPAVVEMMTVKQENAPFDTIFVGIAEGSKAVDVRAQVGGILRERVYQEGQYVNAGDVLFVIESDTYEAALKVAQGNLDNAKAQLRQAKLDYDRKSNLYKTSSISKSDYDSAVATYEMAKAQVETAQGNLSDSKIRLGYANVVAPVSGYTSRANFTEGNLITTADANPLTVVNQVNPIHVTFSIPAATMSSIRLLASEGRVTIADNLTSTLYFGDGVKYPEQGNIIFFDKMITSATGDIKAKAEFPNPYMAVLPGQYVRATLDGYTFVNAIIIPQKAVIQRQGQQMVIVVDEQNIAHFTPVELGMNLGNKFLVTKGLQAGDRIVIEGTNKVMRDSSPVMDKAQMMQMMQQRMQGQAANKPQSQNTQQTQGGNNSQSQQAK